MSSHTMPRLLATLSFCGLALAASPDLLAQSRQTPPAQPDALRGPEVHDRKVPGVEGSFGQPGGERKRLGTENRLPPRVFREAMQVILAPDAADNLRVSDEQRAKYQDWMDDFQSSVADYMKEHAAELRELRRKAGEPGRPGQRGPDARNKPQADEMMPADAKETGAARERLQTIMQGAPKIEDLYTKIWTELSPAQQAAVDAHLQQFRDQQAKEREERYVKQKLGQKKGDAPNAPKAGDKPQPRPGATDRAPLGARPQGAAIDPERRDRLMRLFARLTPEQQEQLLQRLERARGEGADNPPPGPARRRGGPAGAGEPKPAPEPDDSMMPPPPAGRP